MHRPIRCIFFLSPLFFGLVILIEAYIFYISITYKNGPDLSAPWILENEKLKIPGIFETRKSELKDGIWQPVHGASDKFYVYSAYLEARNSQRRPVIRVIGVARFYKHRTIMNTMALASFEKVVCQFWDEESNSSNTVGADFVPGIINAMKENWGMNYSACFIYCPIPLGRKIPASVSIYSQSIFDHAILDPQDGKKHLAAPGNRLPVGNRDISKVEKTSLAACVKPFHFNFQKVWQLVEWMELHMELGISHFYFYNHTMAENTSCVLEDYKEKGLVTVLDWNGVDIESQKEVRTENMFASLNDCLYRGMGKFKYLAFLDFDEFLVPKKHKTLTELLEEEDTEGSKYASFSFRNTFFYLQWPDDQEAPDSNLVTLRKTRRRDGFHPTNHRSKYICKPEKTFEVGNHMLWKSFNSTFKQKPLDPKSACLHHYRVCEFGGETCLDKKSVTDRHLWKFKDSLQSRVAEVRDRLGSKCELGPFKI